MLKVKGRSVVISLILLVAVVVAWLILSLPPSSGNHGNITPSSHYRNISPYEQISFEEAEQQMGFSIPTPAHVPEGFMLSGLYLFPPTEDVAQNADANLPPKPPFEPFQVVFTRDMDVLILRLEGGDTRVDDETYARTGGDVPVDFNLQGDRVDVSGTVGVVETNLDKTSIIGAKMHTQLIWRLPCTSTKMPILTGLFLALESNTLSATELLEVAESVQPCSTH